MLNILVSIKQVPDTTNIRINPETGTLIREGVPSIINPYDIVALSLAYELKLRFKAKVTAITMGPPQAKNALKEAVEFGADRIVLLCDRKFAGADTLATSYTIAEAIRFLQKEEPFDLYLFGKQAIDGDTAQVGPGVANRLGIPVISYVVKIENLDPIHRKIVVHRKTERGIEVLEAAFPVLLTCEKDLSPLPFVPLENILKAQRAEPEIFNAEGPISFQRDKLGLKGSPTQVKKVYTPELKRVGKMYNLDDVSLDDVVSEILGVLRERDLL